MPRRGLTATDVAACAADMADESGIESVTLAAVAARLGVKPPALYKHIDGIADLHRRIATVAMTELGEQLRDALQGRAGADAIAASIRVLSDYTAAHPGRYAATTGVAFSGPDDPFTSAATRVMASARAAIDGYGIAPDQLDHAVRTLRCLIHGFALLRSADGFQWDADTDASSAWMVAFVDAGLRGVAQSGV